MADKLNQVAIRMIEQPPLLSKEPMDSPEAAIRVMQEFLSEMDRELFCIVNLQSDLKPINMNIVSVGALNQSLTHPREVFKSAILSNAAGILMIHNHPSGNLAPSKEDIYITDRLRQAGDILGIQLFDHIITGREKEYFSFRNAVPYPEILPILCLIWRNCGYPVWWQKQIASGSRYQDMSLIRFPLLPVHFQCLEKIWTVFWNH